MRRTRDQISKILYGKKFKQISLAQAAVVNTEFLTPGILGDKRLKRRRK